MTLYSKILAIFFITIAFSCAPKYSPPSQTLDRQNMSEQENIFIHTVFFWLHDGVSEKDKSIFLKGLQNLRSIKTVQTAYIGTPAMTPRDVVDNSYDYALIIHFRNKEDHDFYQEAPVHLKFIEDSKHIWNRVQVYDTLLDK